MEAHISVCGEFFKNEGSVSRAVFIVVKPEFDLVAFISGKTFLSQLAECKSPPSQKIFLSEVQVFR